MHGGGVNKNKNKEREKVECLEDQDNNKVNKNGIFNRTVKDSDIYGYL